MRMGSQMLERLAAAAAAALGCRTAFRPDLMSSLNIQIDTPRNCSTSQDLPAVHPDMLRAVSRARKEEHQSSLQVSGWGQIPSGAWPLGSEDSWLRQVQAAILSIIRQLREANMT